MNRLGLLLVVSLAAAAPLTAQGPGRVALSAIPAKVVYNAHAVAADQHSGMTRSEKGALIGAVAGIITGMIVSYHYDEKGFFTMFGAGVVLAIPVSLIGAIIGMM